MCVCVCGCLDKWFIKVRRSCGSTGYRLCRTMLVEEILRIKLRRDQAKVTCNDDKVCGTYRDSHRHYYVKQVGTKTSKAYDCLSLSLSLFCKKKRKRKDRTVPHPFDSGTSHLFGCRSSSFFFSVRGCVRDGHQVGRCLPPYFFLHFFCLFPHF